METFHIVPASSKLFVAIFAVVMLVLLGVGAILATSAYSSQRARFDLSPDGLRLRGEWLYRSFVPASALRGAAARIVDLDSEPALRPAMRTFGTGMPGYLAGWVRLRNGDKALVYLTDRSAVVHVPTTDGYSVLLSVTEPERFLAQLRVIAPAP